MRDENYELAESIARKVINDAPDDSASWLALTYPLMLSGQFEAAIKSCDKALAIAPNDKTLLYTRGFIAQEQGDACLDGERYDKADEHFNSAIRYYTKAIDLDSDFADAHYGLAAAHEGLGNDTRVIHHAQRYLELYPDSPKKNDALDMIRVATEYIAKKDKTEQSDEPEPE